MNVRVYCYFYDGFGMVLLGEGVERGYHGVKFDDGCVKSVNLANHVSIVRITIFYCCVIFVIRFYCVAIDEMFIECC